MDGSSSGPHTAEEVRDSMVRTPGEISDATWIDSVGTTASPLLAGFSLASVMVVINDPTHFRLPSATILALTVAAAVFIVALQFAQIARRSFKAREDLPTSDRLYDKDKEAASRFTTDGYDKRFVALNDATWWFKRARRAYHTGILALLLGLAFALVPEPRTGIEGGLRWWAFGIAVAAFIAEAIGRSKSTDFSHRYPSWVARAKSNRR
jgi:hypothetical protein